MIEEEPKGSKVGKLYVALNTLLLDLKEETETMQSQVEKVEDEIKNHRERIKVLERLMENKKK